MTTFNPKFLVKNMIDSVSTLSDSASTSEKYRRYLFDRNSSFQWESIGQTTGTRTITWTPTTTKTVNRIYLQNINWKDFTIKYNTSNDFNPAINITGNSDTNIYFEVADQAITNIVFSITDTITTGQTAKAGQIYIGTQLFEIDTQSGGRLNIAQPRSQQFIITLADGTTNKVFIRETLDWALQLIHVTEANRQNYIDLFNRNRREPFVFIPYPKTKSDSWDGISNHYNWVNAPDFYNYSLQIVDNGFDINIELSQAGGV